MMLSEKHPSVFAEFKAGNFVINKTGHKFSAMAIDQCREQINAPVKGSGGAISLMRNLGGLRRWTMAGPEIVRITEEFEGGKDQSEEKRHHGAQPGLQRKFVNEVMSLVTTIGEMGNPFLEDGHDLPALDTRNIMNASVVDSIINFESLGLEQHRKFVK